MYAAITDPYCYPGTTVLKNKQGLRTQQALKRFEAALTAQRFQEPLPNGRLSVEHYKAIHRHLFQDVYAWAGRFRSVRISKGDNTFCYPENIQSQMTSLFRQLRGRGYLRGLSANEFAADAASFLATLNAVHPFRDGNGRTQLAFMAELASRAGHPLHLGRLKAKPFLQAMVESFAGSEGKLREQIRNLVR